MQKSGLCTQLHESNRYDPMDGGGRIASGTAVESRVRKCEACSWNTETESSDCVLELDRDYQKRMRE
jgi:hypothetical protein